MAGLGTLTGLLAHDSACLVLDEVRLLQTGLGLVDLAKEGVTPGEPCGDDLLLHSLHGLHGCHGLHGLHGFHGFGHLELEEKMLEEQLTTSLEPKWQRRTIV